MNASTPFLYDSYPQDLARFSPDGRWIAYESNETGRQEVWVAVYRADEHRLAQRWQISSEGGRDPLWSPDGSTLYFEDFGDRLVAVPVERTSDGLPAFGEHAVQVALRSRDLVADGDQSYDVAPDGSGFLFIEDTAGAATEARVVLDWFAELARLLP